MNICLVLKHLMKSSLTKKIQTSLCGKRISDIEYRQHVWNKSEMKTMKMKDYYDLYLKLDTLMIANIFEKFRNKCLEKYSSCLSLCLRPPDLSWGTMPNMSKVEPDLISDVGMYLFLERGMKVSVSYISKRYG